MRYLSLAYLVLTLVLPACDGNTRERRAARAENFVSDPDHLYFKNIRSREYRVVSISEGVDEYRHDELGEAANLVIIDRWIDDQAQLQWDGRILSSVEVLELRRFLHSEPGLHLYPESSRRAAAIEAVDDYLRLTAYPRPGDN